MYSCPSVSMGDSFQDHPPPWLQKSADAQAPYVKWCRAMHTVGL